GDAACKQIRWNEGHTPALDLPDVRLLVIAAEFEAPGISSDDHMAERHRREAPFLAQPSGEPAVKFDCTAANLGPAAGAHGERARDKAHHRCRSGPSVPDQSANRPVSIRRSSIKVSGTRQLRLALPDD